MGWHYPAGAEGDPNAPYNQDDEDFTCVCGHEMDDHDAVMDDEAQPCAIAGCDCEQYREVEPEDEEEDRWGDD
jgi:hypothetical protein